jgi:pyridoxine 5-phosphate synthase
MAKLSVNVNKVATLRNTRPNLNLPSVRHVATIAINAGAHGITVHPRPDQRHIKPHDVHELAELVRSFPTVEYNIEGNPFDEYLRYAKDVRPTQCTLVPDTVEQSTSDHGWDTIRDADNLRPIIARLKEFGCRVSIFLDPDERMVDGAAKLGADRIELYTEPYAAAFARREPTAVDAYARAARRAEQLGLGVNAGHDLNLDNLPHFIKHVPQTLEVSIGHALIGDALEFGMAKTVRKYLTAASSSDTR